MARLRARRWPLPVVIVLSAILFSSTSTAELFRTAISPVVQDGLINKASTQCPVAQDGYTYNTFPWTHYPTCVKVILPAGDGEDLGVHQTFCAYSNTNYNGGRGVSFVVSPEVASSISFESFGMAVGGSEDQIGEEMGIWEVLETDDRGKGLFARKDLGKIFAGDDLIIKTPALLISRQLLETPSTTRRDFVLSTAFEQLPEDTRQVLKNLAKSWGGSEAVDIIKTNGIDVHWPWVDEVPQLLAVTPEIARINHACRPNAMWRFNDYTLAFDVFALKEIQPGEEITLSYGYEKRSHGRRTRSLQANHNFSCLCSLCTASPAEIEASNDRLADIKAVKSILPTDPADSPQLLGLLSNLIKLYDDEDLHTETPMYEEILAYTWSSFGIPDRAKYWAGRARQHWAVLMGKESWEAKRCGDLENNVKAHATWMTWEGDPWEGALEEGHPWEEREDNDHAGGQDEGYAHREDEKENLKRF
ncbi:hypothetical protein BDU57DRAFT_545010 [Ampelomyces quisqualis]|uniref:SET domain-containing protein n=1 Tax=Ampelomyces quisqualis TaxID=50730 RepID=A0A6A5R321_AMPQU|nr:hypothetical protein BDU57DRAFT_545010 [Ampelomyces quisqualis]